MHVPTSSTHHVWQLKKLEQLDAISDRLEQLWVSYNLLTNLAGVESCSKLRCLYAGNNNISDPRELSRLQVLDLCKRNANPRARTDTAITRGGGVAW